MNRQKIDNLEIAVVIIFLILGFMGMIKMFFNFFEGMVQMGISFIIAKLSIISMELREK